MIRREGGRGRASRLARAASLSILWVVTIYTYSQTLNGSEVLQILCWSATTNNIVVKWAKLGKQGWRFGMNQKSS